MKISEAANQYLRRPKSSEELEARGMPVIPMEFSYVYNPVVVLKHVEALIHVELYQMGMG